ncbi:hypothetical protein SAMN05421505_11674 [Sinosporangium album]|uniref:Terpene synthase family, metal binding domain n=1 Tax=Sinosporangium album TaxID=504805 RepID=A0A1G8CPK8_9ACTN|nr:terpene synthase family protein [Sinosporangium album]SDH46800.1 hypothetical protein SAMN05421505_11674 [Sinosporangium album]
MNNSIRTLWPAAEAGRISAAAGKIQRALGRCAATYPGLYRAEAFDPALQSTLADALAHSAPWLDADRLMMAGKASFWAFGLDWLVDYAADSQDDVDDVVRRCLAVADGGRPADDDDLARFLADLRDELSAAPAFPALRGVWRDELGRMLAGMRTEWEWKAARAEGRTDVPDLRRYLANADNLGFTFVLVSHWVTICESPAPDDVHGVHGIHGVLAAASEVQRVIRLLNDQGTYRRDTVWGDLNALMLDTHEAVNEALARHTRRARELLAALRVDQPDLADFMERQMDFCAGFYRVTDFWGEL